MMLPDVAGAVMYMYQLGWAPHGIDLYIVSSVVFCGGLHLPLREVYCLLTHKEEEPLGLYLCL